MSRTILMHSLAASLLAAAVVAPQRGQDRTPEAAFHRAYYLQHERQDLEGALELYRSIAESRSADRELREQAQAQVRALSEDLVASDLSRLMPPQTILYAEIDRPGAKVATLLDQLGLLGAPGAQQQKPFAVSPQLVRGLLGMRGAALAITGIDPRGGPPSGVLVVHPGELDVVRGLIETAIPAGAQPAEPIGGHPTWDLEGQAFATLTSRLLVIASDRQGIEGVLARIDGKEQRSLAGSQALRQAFDGGQDGLVRFFVNAEPVRPMLRGMLEQQAQRDPQARMMLSLLDVDSLESLSGRLAVGEDGIGLDVALRLAEGHRNLVFNLLRKPQLEAGTLELVPEGAAAFLAAAVNPRQPAARAQEPEVVTAMDFGRELFGNLVDVVVYALPPADGAPVRMHAPDVVAVLRANDVERSKALWSLMLGLAAQSTGAQELEPARVTIAGAEAQEFGIQGLPVYLLARGDELWLSPSRGAIERSLQARKAGATVARDARFAKALDLDLAGRTSILAISPGRCAAMAQGMLPPQESQKAAMVAEVLKDTVVTLDCVHSATVMAMSLKVHDVPDVSGLVAQAIRGGRSHANGVVRIEGAPAPRPASAPLAGGSARIASKLRELAADPARRNEAEALGEALLAAGPDANTLNSLAWNLLTEDAFGNRHDALALRLAQRCDELTGSSNWMYVDTLAHAHFHAGDVDEAIRLEERALDLAGSDPRAAECEAALARFRAAQQPLSTTSASDV